MKSRSACSCARAGTPTASRGVAASPACGPAAVTSVPAVSSAASTAPVVAIKARIGRGTSGRAGPSPSVAACTSCTASHTSTIETRKCTLTLHQARPVRTVTPPITACVTTPSGWTSASRTSRGRRGRVPSAASRQRPATSTTAKVSSRLPNSIHCVSAATSGCGVGTRLPGKHCGQVGQPRPEPVTRTTDPVSAMPACATTAAIASRRITAGGTGTIRSRSAGRATC